MTRTPDEDYDVVAHYFPQRGGTWTIWRGDTKYGERATREGAIELARAVAVAHHRPAWLLDETGYPLKPIERDTLH